MSSSDEECEVTRICHWSDMKSHFHPNLWNDPLAYDKWGQVCEVCKRKLGWLWSDDLEIGGCDSWRALVELFASHRDKEWKSKWENKFDYPLDE